MAFSVCVCVCVCAYFPPFPPATCHLPLFGHFFLSSLVQIRSDESVSQLFKWLRTETNANKMLGRQIAFQFDSSKFIFTCVQTNKKKTRKIEWWGNIFLQFDLLLYYSHFSFGCIFAAAFHIVRCFQRSDTKGILTDYCIYLLQIIFLYSLHVLF